MRRKKRLDEAEVREIEIAESFLKGLFGNFSTNEFYGAQEAAERFELRKYGLFTTDYVELFISLTRAYILSGRKDLNQGERVIPLINLVYEKALNETKRYIHLFAKPFFKESFFRDIKALPNAEIGCRFSRKIDKKEFIDHLREKGLILIFLSHFRHLNENVCVRETLKELGLNLDEIKQELEKECA